MGGKAASFDLALVYFYLDLIETHYNHAVPGAKKKKEENNIPWVNQPRASFREREASMSTLPLWLQIICISKQTIRNSEQIQSLVEGLE